MLDEVQAHTDNDQKPGSTKELGDKHGNPHLGSNHSRNQGNDGQEARPDVRDAFHHRLEVLRGARARTETGDKGTVVAKLFAHLFGREDHGGPEVAKEVDQTDLDQHVGIRTHLQVRIQERESRASTRASRETPRRIGPTNPKQRSE